MSMNTLAQQALDRRLRPALAAERQEDLLSGLAKYIPTEVITLFLFGLSVLAPAEGVAGWINVRLLFWLLLAFTPLCFWLIFAAKFRAQHAGQAWPRFDDLPWWRLTAATIGFAVWAPAVPKAGLIPAGYGVALATLALFLSTLFSLIERACEPRPFRQP